MIDRNPPRFATLLGRELITWGTEGPDYERLVERPLRYRSWT
jgi:hypothetical protein